MSDNSPTAQANSALAQSAAWSTGMVEKVASLEAACTHFSSAVDTQQAAAAAVLAATAEPPAIDINPPQSPVTAAATAIKAEPPRSAADESAVAEMLEMLVAAVESEAALLAADLPPPQQPAPNAAQPATLLLATIPESPHSTRDQPDLRGPGGVQEDAAQAAAQDEAAIAVAIPDKRDVTPQVRGATRCAWRAAKRCYNHV